MAKNPRVNFAELAILASSCGLVDSSDAGRSAFVAWLQKDQKAARKALFTRVAARRAAAAKPHRPINAAETQALRTGESTRYPQWMRGTNLSAASVVRSSGSRRQQQQSRRPRVTEGND